MNGALRPGETWRTRAGRIVLDQEDPRGMPLDTPLDRRWLWRIEHELGVSAANDTLRQLGADLYAYLTETCRHHWLRSAGDESVGAHEQCMWCGTVTFEGEAANQVARMILGTPEGDAG